MFWSPFVDTLASVLLRIHQVEHSAGKQVLCSKLGVDVKIHRGFLHNIKQRRFSAFVDDVFGIVAFSSVEYVHT